MKFINKTLLILRLTTETIANDIQPQGDSVHLKPFLKNFIDFGFIKHLGNIIDGIHMAEGSEQLAPELSLVN